MIIRTKHFALQIGYQVATDTYHGFTLWLWHRHGVPAYRLCISLVFNWPQLIWAHRDWAVNEPGSVHGMAVRRQGNRLMWLGRTWRPIGWSWFVKGQIRRYD